MNENKKRFVASALSILFAMTIITSSVVSPQVSESQQDIAAVLDEASSAHE